MKYLAPVTLILLAAIIFMAGCATTTPTLTAGTDATGSETIVVDALIAFTGSYSASGEPAKAALLTAEEDINQYYQSVGSADRVKVLFYDTGSDPVTAVGLIKQIHANGRRIVLGYLTSAEITAIKTYTDANGMVFLDAGSTSSSLAIPGDSIYRLISDDSAQGRAMGIWLEKNSIHTIVPLWRGDIWGDGLVNSTRTAFSARKGVTSDGVRYDPATTDFAEYVTSLDILTGKAIDTYGSDRVGIYIVGFKESATILGEASGKQNLSIVRWFGCDGNTGISSLAGSTPAARFAARVNLSGTIWGIAYGDTSSGPQIRIRERLGYQPDSGKIAFYDALWVVKDVIKDTPADAKQAQIETALVRHMSTYDGESKSLMPNAAGDRALASYDVMQVVSGEAGSVWKKVAHVITWPDRGEEVAILP